ncbi:MAG: hypothetical protein LBH98_10165 [Chitinispirillales bacterium]|jgi:uncharacterized protein involved in exopolysaccharide biosynthesis|nr:hypothetical protein [Chitinispirillales bacterium]
MENEMTAEQFNREDEIDLRELVLVVLKNWMIVTLVTAAISAVIAVWAIVLPDQYVAAAVAVAAKRSSGEAGQMAGLAAMAGINIPTGGSDVNLINYVDLLVENTSFCEKIIEREWIVQRLQTKEEIKKKEPFIYDTLTLAEYWKFRNPDTTAPNWEYKYKMAQINKLRSKKGKFMSIEKDKVKGTIEIKTRFQNPSLAYSIHEYLIEYLKKYIESDYLNRGKEKREFVEERVADARMSLNRAESYLVGFKEKNLAAQSPSVILEGERLQREVVLKASVYAELIKQLELAKIDEKKETPAFEVIKEADYPLYPSEPNRKLLILIGIFAGIFAGIFIVFMKEWIISIRNA